MVLMPEVGILFLIHIVENFTREEMVERLNARGGHFVFNTCIIDDSKKLELQVLMPEVGILFLILKCVEDLKAQYKKVLMPEVGILFLIRIFLETIYRNQY